MESLDKVINEARDAREVKRALCVKMRLSEMAISQICELLNVSPQYVSKWSGIYEAEGVPGLKVGYAGSESYLSPSARTEIMAWIQAQETISVAVVRDHLEAEYKVVYQSRQSYYDLLAAAGMSYHKSEKRNPKHDEAQVQERRAEIKKKLEQHQEEIAAGEMIVLLEDECHLLWGDCLGYVWGKRGEAIEVWMLNEKERQTYYGAVN